jgi:zinc protease
MLVVGLAIAPVLVANDGSAAATQAPGARSADAILADYVNAMGGKAALGRHKSLHVKRKITVTGMGIEGQEERVAATGDRFFASSSIPGMGTVRQASDGKTFWSDDPINGLRLLTGPEKDQVRLDATWNGELRMTELYKKISVVPRPKNAPGPSDEIAGVECLELVPAESSPLVTCFDTGTHRRIFLSGRQTTPQGEVPFETRFSDWKTFEGIELPMREDSKMGPLSVEVRVTDVKFDEKVDPSLFKLKRPAGKPSKNKKAP